MRSNGRLLFPKTKAEESAAKVGYWFGWFTCRLVFLKLGWWVFGLEGWSGLPLPWGVAIFAAILLVPPRPAVRSGF